jgi:HD-GYP domain-containing protein (c-di-GMP phosphodiesterase class II)
MRRYLPLAALTTGVVMVLPAVLVSAIVPNAGVVSIIASGLLAIALSVAIATAGAALWKRQPRSRDIVFSDLLLWGWARRCWTERRLSQARELYDSARKSGPGVSIELLTGLSRLLEARDAYTHGHGQRVSRHAAQIARAMHLSPVEVAKIRTAATVHDIGKLYTPREILNNPNRLTDAEFEVAKRHAAWGGRMLANVGDPAIAAMVRHHHERIDGHGYPDGLAGSEIPLGARIIAVADTFDAITSTRAYRAARTQKSGLDVLSGEAGGQLDAVVVAAFSDSYSARRSVAWLSLLAALPQRLLAALPSASQNFGAGVAGASSLLPGLGVAGLLALSPGLQQNPLAVQGVHPAPGVPAAHAPAAPTAVNRASGRASGKALAAPAPTIHRRSAGTGRRAPQAPSSGSGTATRPGSTSPSSGAGGPGPGAGGGGSPTPPTGIPPAPTPPPVTPPATEVPAVPAPPVVPPVTIPSVPGVNLPPVHVPTVPGTGLAPGTGVPGG